MYSWNRPCSIRCAPRAPDARLGIVSDARYRFERGVDPEFVIPGLELATRLILEFCGGEPSDIVVAGGAARMAAQDPLRACRSEAPRRPRPAAAEIVRILTNLGFAVTGGDVMEVVPPSWRSDVHGAADLVEEIVRIHGLDKVPAVPMKRPYAVARPVLTPAQRRASFARRALAARGFDETVHFSFIPRAHAALFGGGDEARQLENPISADLDAMRPSLLPSLLAAAQRNQARGFAQAMLFEIGAQFESGMPEAQTTIAAGIRAGEPPRHWTKGGTRADVFGAKADALAALEAAWGQVVTAPVQAGAAPWYHPGRSGTIALGPKPLAYFGELHPRILAAFDLKGPVSGFEIFLDAIPEPKARATKARAKLEALRPDGRRARLRLRPGRRHTGGSGGESRARGRPPIDRAGGGFRSLRRQGRSGGEEIARHRGQAPAQGAHADRRRNRGHRAKTRERRGQGDRRGVEKLTSRALIMNSSRIRRADRSG